ncbi:baseplate J/gp47 family protein [bacterium]|nr:baseplate J/gp47 family protein [bacterium]
MPTKKTAAEIKADLAEGFAGAGVSNFNAGGTAVTLIEAIGDTQAAFYDYGSEAARSTIAATAKGVWLDEIVKDRSLVREDAVKTQGVVYLSRSAAADVSYPIAAGKILATNKDLAGVSYRFLVLADAELPAGETEVAVSVEAESAGQDFNVPVGAISKIITGISGIQRVENRAGWITREGADRESDERLYLRYQLAWDRLATGATNAALASMAMDADPSVAIAWVDSNFPRGRGTTNIYILGTAGLPTAGLLATVQAYVDAHKAGGDDILVLAPAYRTVDVSMTVYRYANTDEEALDTTIREALAAYFNPLGSALYKWIRPLGVGRKVVFTQLVEIVTRPEETYDVVFADPAADVPVGEDELPVLGDVEIAYEEVVP